MECMYAGEEWPLEEPKEEMHEVLQVMARMHLVAPAAPVGANMPPVRGLRQASFDFSGTAVMLPRCGSTLTAQPEEDATICNLCRQPYPRTQAACVYCGLRVADRALLTALEVPVLR